MLNILKFKFVCLLCIHLNFSAFNLVSEPPNDSWVLHISLSDLFPAHTVALHPHCAVEALKDKIYASCSFAVVRIFDATWIA